MVLLLREEYKIKHYSDLYDNQVLRVEKKDPVIYISGLGKYTPGSLEMVSNAITEYYGVKCEIIGSMDTYPLLYNSKGKLDVTSCSRYLSHTNKTIYVTDEYMVSDVIVAGAADESGTFIILSDNFNNLKNTARHEMAHTLGLDHCENKCVMGNHELSPNFIDFCNDCKLKLKTKLK